MTSEIIQKYSKYTTADLKKRAITKFNAYIRKRDEGKMCISCGKHPIQHAGHFYSAGKFNVLRFNEDNVHGQCIQCNYYLHGNLINYRENLIRKIGIHKFNHLEELSKQRTSKDDRLTLIHIIEKYK